MTEVKVTIKRQPDGEIRCRVEGHGHKSHPEEVGDGELKMTFQMSGKGNDHEVDFGRRVEAAVMGLTGPGKFIGPQIDIVTRVVEGGQN